MYHTRLIPLLLAMVASPVLADPPDPVMLVAGPQLRPGSDGEQQRFGTSMSYTTYRGGRLLVGKPDEDGPLENVGAVAQYQRVAGGWELVVQFIAPSAFRQENSGFGESVSVFGEWAIVGAPYEDVEGTVDAGAVYFYRYNANTGYYQFHSRSTLTDVQADSHFGSAVALRAGRAAAGAPHWDLNAQTTDTGRVQLYELGDSGDSWPLTSSRSPPDAVGSESFGAALAIYDAPASDPDRLFIGAPTTTVDGQAVAGRVHHYRSTAEDWEPVEIMELFAPDVLDWYGCALAVSGKYLFIGMRGRSKPGGADKGGGVEVQRLSEVGVYIPVGSLFPLEEQSGARFGAALALGNGSAPRLIVGAPGEDSNEPGTVTADAGRVYSFDAVPSGDDHEWQQTNSLGVRGDPVAGDELGYSVAVTGDGRTAFAGAPFRVFGAGRVQIYVGDAIFIDGFNPIE